MVATAEQRILEAAMLVPAHGAVTGWGGLHWIGCHRWFEGTDPDGLTPRLIWVAIAGEHVRPQSGTVMSEERLNPRDVMVMDGVRVTTAVRSACFDMRYATSVRAAARVLSMAAYHDAVSIAEMVEYAARHSGWTGIPQCREAVELAEENCWSPTELDMVLAWRLDAGLPRPLCNRPIFDRSGRHIGTPDLLDEEAGVVGEYDGSIHLVASRRRLDIDREERYRRVGLEYFTVVAAHRALPDALAERMNAVRSRAAYAAATNREWSVVPPSWWIPTHTVERRRELSPYERRRVLRYRDTGDSAA